MQPPTLGEIADLGPEEVEYWIAATEEGTNKRVFHARSHEGKALRMRMGEIMPEEGGETSAATEAVNIVDVPRGTIEQGVDLHTRKDVALAALAAMIGSGRLSKQQIESQMSPDSIGRYYEVYRKAVLEDTSPATHAELRTVRDQLNKAQRELADARTTVVSQSKIIEDYKSRLLALSQPI